MNKKLLKTLFELSLNSRITTKELGKKIRSSQQSSSYLLKQLKRKKIILDYNVIIDNAKLNLMNLMVGLNYLDFNSEVKKSIINELKNNKNCTSLEEAVQGVDVIVEFSYENLSAFNKEYVEFIQKNHKSVETKFMFPIIVKHKYPKKYLSKLNTFEEMVFCGDRKMIFLNENEKKILNVIVDNPDDKLIDLSKKTKLNVKTLSNIKKNLEKKKIIRGYSCVLNHRKLGINREYIYLKFASGKVKEIEKFLEFSKLHKNIIELIKIIGIYEICIVVESVDVTEIVKEIRSIFPVDEYLSVNVEKITKKIYMPQEYF